MGLRVSLENYCKHDECEFDTNIESKFHQLSQNSYVNNNLFTFLRCRLIITTVNTFYSI